MRRKPNPWIPAAKFPLRRRRRIPDPPRRLKSGRYRLYWRDRYGRPSKFRPGKFLRGVLVRVTKPGKKGLRGRLGQSLRSRVARHPAAYRRARALVSQARRAIAKRPDLYKRIRKMYAEKVEPAVAGFAAAREAAGEVAERYYGLIPPDYRFELQSKYDDLLSQWDELVALLRLDLAALDKSIREASRGAVEPPPGLWTDTDAYARAALTQWGVHPDAWEAERHAIEYHFGARTDPRTGRKEAERRFDIDRIYLGPKGVAASSQLRWMFYKDIPEKAFDIYAADRFYLWAIFEVPPRLSPHINFGKLKTPRVTSILAPEFGKSGPKGERRALMGFPLTYRPSASAAKDPRSAVKGAFSPTEFFEWIHQDSKFADEREIDPGPKGVPYVREGAKIWQTLCLNAIGYHKPELERDAKRGGAIKCVHLLGWYGDFWTKSGTGIYTDKDFTDEEEDQYPEYEG